MEEQGKIKIRCPYCEQKIRLDSNLKTVTCPKCNGPFMIEEEAPPPMPEINPTVKPAILIHPPSSLNPDEANCPKCNGVIKREAIFCRHCKNNIQEEVSPVRASGIRLKKFTNTIPHTGISNIKRREKEFVITGNYSEIFAAVKQGFLTQEYEVLEDNPRDGLLICKRLRAWVHLIFSIREGSIVLEWGIDSDNIRYLFMTEKIKLIIEYSLEDYKNGELRLEMIPSYQMPPEYRKRQGISYSKAANSGIIWAIFAILFCGLFCIFGGFFSIVALSRIDNSRNQSQYGKAIIGIVLSILAIPVQLILLSLIFDQ
jgi:Zn finger protein HypA/HybF involved in hydrogenase expression